MKSVSIWQSYERKYLVATFLSNTVWWRSYYSIRSRRENWNLWEDASYKRGLVKDLSHRMRYRMCCISQR